MRAQVRRLDALTGLRFVAAAAVVVLHIDGRKISPLFGLRPDFPGDFPLGYSGLTFFFVLSGFILAYVYPTLESPVAAGRFLLARFARLWPAHLFGIAVSMAVDGRLLWQTPDAVFEPLPSLLIHAAMLQAWVPAYHMIFQYNIPSWSVSTEFTFYLFFIPLMRNWARSWWWKLALALALPVGLIAVANARGWPWQVPPGHADYGFALYFHPLARLWQFVLGMAAAHLWRRYGQGRVGPALGTLWELAAVALCLGVSYYSADVSRAAGELAWVGRGGREFLHNSGGMTAVPFAVLIFVMAGQWGLVSRLFATRPMVFLGDISFGVYILHWPLQTYAQRHWIEFLGVPGWVLHAAYWAVLLGLSWWMYAFVERPARRWLVGLWPAQSAGGHRAALAALARSRTARAVLGTCALAALMLAIALRGDRGNFRFVDPQRVDRLVQYAPYSTRGVRFGDYYLLRGATWHQAHGGVELHTVWECLKTQPPGCKIWVQGVESKEDAKGLWAVASIPKLPQCPIFAGWVWEERTFIPQALIESAPQVVLIAWNKEETEFLRVYGPALDHPFRLRVSPPIEYTPPPAPPDAVPPGRS